MKLAVLAAFLGMATPAALLAQTVTPPTDSTVTGTMPSGEATGGAASQNPVVMPHSEAAPAPATRRCCMPRSPIPGWPR